MSIINENQRLVLSFIQAANHGGYSPTPDEVGEWVERPGLKAGKVTRRTVRNPGAATTGAYSSAFALFDESASRNLAKTLEDINRNFLRSIGPVASQLGALSNLWGNERVIEEREPDETVVQQVQRFRWVRASSTGVGLVLTALGLALLRADTDQSAASEVTVLDGEDPLAWGALVGTIAEIGECLIVDPYLKAEQFLDIAKFTGTTRVILRRPAKERELVSWRIHQALPDVSVDIRIVDPQLIHDRYIVGENAVYGLGCSLSGVGRKPTTLVPMTGPVADHIRSIVEGWWEVAEPVGDPPLPEGGTTQGNGAST